MPFKAHNQPTTNTQTHKGTLLMPFEDANKMLEGGGAPVAKFTTPGDTHKGRLVNSLRRQQTDLEGKPKFYDDGNVMWELVLTIDTDTPDDNGITLRRLFVKGKGVDAVREAVKEAGAPMTEGGVLTLRYTGDGEQTRKGYSPPKLFKAKYEPPKPAAFDLDEL